MNRVKFVTSPIKHRLELGDEVIKEVKQLLPFGQGNQTPIVERTQGRSYAAVHEIEMALGDDWQRPLRNAGVSTGYGAGNCQNMAAMVYTILRSRLSASESTSFCHHPGVLHWFTTIGNVSTDSANEVVVVDPWPLKPQACLLEDHFCGEGYQLHRVKRGGKPNLQARLHKHTPKDWREKQKDVRRHTYEIEFNAPNSHWWNHTYCTKDNAKISYKTLKVTMSRKPK